LKPFFLLLKIAFTHVGVLFFPPLYLHVEFVSFLLTIVKFINKQNKAKSKVLCCIRTNMKLNKFHYYCGIPQKPWFYLMLLPASHVKCLQWDILIHSKQKQKKIFVRRESRIGCWKVRDSKKEWIFNLHRCVLLYIKYKRSKWEREES